MSSTLALDHLQEAGTPVVRQAGVQHVDTTFLVHQSEVQVSGGGEIITMQATPVAQAAH